MTGIYSIIRVEPSGRERRFHSMGSPNEHSALTEFNKVMGYDGEVMQEDNHLWLVCKNPDRKYRAEKVA